MGLPPREEWLIGEEAPMKPDRQLLEDYLDRKLDVETEMQVSAMLVSYRDWVALAEPVPGPSAVAPAAKTPPGRDRR